MRKMVKLAIFWLLAAIGAYWYGFFQPMRNPDLSPDPATNFIFYFAMCTLIMLFVITSRSRSGTEPNRNISEDVADFENALREFKDGTNIDKMNLKK